MDNKNFYLDDLITNQRQTKLKRNLKLIFGLIVVIIFIIIIIIITSISSDKNSDELPDIYTVFKQNTFFFFDPVSKKSCNEKNYWTPFDQSTTCYRFVSVTDNDTDKNNTIRIMLDHSIAASNFSEYKNVLKEKTSNWKRYKGEIDIIDESTIYRIMKYKEKPTKNTTVSAPIHLPYYSYNSFYRNRDVCVCENGHWTNTSYDINTSYAIDINGRNMISSKASTRIPKKIHIKKFFSKIFFLLKFYQKI